MKEKAEAHASAFLLCGIHARINGASLPAPPPESTGSAEDAHRRRFANTGIDDLDYPHLHTRRQKHWEQRAIRQQIETRMRRSMRVGPRSRSKQDPESGPALSYLPRP